MLPFDCSVGQSRYSGLISKESCERAESNLADVAYFGHIWIINQDHICFRCVIKSVSTENYPRTLYSCTFPNLKKIIDSSTPITPC